MIVWRADSNQPNMGLPRRTDGGIAKNYLTHQEIETLDLAERQARSRTPMTMRDWIAKLDDFLRASDRDLLTHAGTISHHAALAKAQSEFDKFRLVEDAKPQPVDIDFENVIQQAKQIASAKAKRKPKKEAE